MVYHIIVLVINVKYNKKYYIWLLTKLKIRHYYIFTSLIFKNGQLKKAYNQTFSSKNPANIIDFKDYAKGFHAGKPGEDYDAIVIACWQEIDKDTYDLYLKKLPDYPVDFLNNTLTNIIKVFCTSEAVSFGCGPGIYWGQFLKRRGINL